MSIIGITGPICSGKTTLLEYFCKCGEKTISVDALYHQLIKNGEMINSLLIKKYSDKILDGSGNVDTLILRDIVFSKENGIEELNKLVHPVLFSRAYELAETLKIQSQKNRVFVEAAVIFESGYFDKNDHNILIIVKPEILTGRIQKRDSVSKETAIKKIEFQTDFLRYKELFRWIFFNQGNVEELKGFGDKVLLELDKE